MNRFLKPQFCLFIFLAISFTQSSFAQTQRQNFNRSRTFDAQNYTIRTSFDRSQKRIFGETVVSLKPLKNGFKTVELDAADLNFESVTLEPQGTKLKYETESDKIIIALGKTYMPRDLIKIRLKYTAKPAKGVYFVGARRTGGAMLHDAQIWTQGEPEEARHWFPSYDFPDDKATSEQFLTVEKDETAISNGALLDTIENADGTKTFHYRMNAPHSVYLTSFIIGKFVKITDNYRKIPLGVYLYPGKEHLFQVAFGRTKEMFRVFEELTGVAYPFNKYDQTIVANFQLGGMENITATTLSARDIFLSEINPLVIDDLISHELSHSWFGNLVTCRNWAELWLNEGFATFMEAAFREKVYGRANYLQKIEEDRDVYFSEEAEMSRKRGLFNQLARPDASIFNAVAYHKGSTVVHTLREEVGDRIFWKAVNVYLNRFKYSNVETEDLKTVFEEVSKKDLDWFFDQWVYATGYPRLDVKYKYDAATATLNLNVKQVHKIEEITPPAFILPLEIGISTSGGTITENIKITKREEVFAIKLKDPPTNLILDKDLKIPLKIVKVQKIN